MTELDLIALGKRSDRYNIVCDLQRLGAMLFMTRLEYEHFPPDTEKNNIFDFIIVQWPDDFKMNWAVVSVPIEYKPYVYSIATECGLRVADGVPTILGGDNIQTFPLNGPNVFTLENISTSLIYESSVDQLAQLKLEEHEKVNRIHQNHRNRLTEKLIAKGFTQSQIQDYFAEDENE